MINWEKYRALFPVANDKVYFMTAGGGAMPTPVYEAITDRYKAVMHRGGDAFGENIGIMESCREQIAKLINADKESIAFIPNVSFGMNVLAHSLPSQEFVMIPENEFPSSVVPWENIGANIEFVSINGDLQANLNEMLATSVHENFTLITSSISFANGYQLDLDELASHKKSGNLIVNHTQGIGVFPVDVKKQKIDALVCACYKWMCCGEGISFMYISPEFFKKLTPAIVGWRSIQSSMSFNNQRNYFQDARVFELGWDNMTSFAGCEKALELINEIGIQNIAERVKSLSKYLLDALAEHEIPHLTVNDSHHISGNVLIGPFDDPNAVMTALQKENIWVNARGNGIRVSLHFYNNFEDISCLINALKKIGY
ncbi:aminotransferase class V-fold PLP-dependent enzyme [Legionella sp. W05-934-2]|jgi:selenocysteine lyase/cysteine desulfurase|uniref:aminotransferase class V-fold PLP-dependent enzyme n=1 Tax=Legionella sp. W05-934-2 TaxID=1198649 RepID=UPI0034631449